MFDELRELRVSVVECGRQAPERRAFDGGWVSGYLGTPAFGEIDEGSYFVTQGSGGKEGDDPCPQAGCDTDEQERGSLAKLRDKRASDRLQDSEQDKRRQRDQQEHQEEATTSTHARVSERPPSWLLMRAGSRSLVP